MPCEGCHVQFTVFRRKRSCMDCKRFYCSNCLSSSKRPSTLALCQRCKVFAKRPLLKSDLQQMKPKDLIFYLQSKHISTTGCVEKDELVCLVLNHVQQLDAGHHANRSRGANGSFSFGADPGPSFDSLKQTCQNFFSNFTENISESFAAFDSKPEQKPPTPTQRPPNSPTHISDQPRVSPRQTHAPTSFHNHNGGVVGAAAPAQSTTSSSVSTSDAVNNTSAVCAVATQQDNSGSTSTSAFDSNSRNSPAVSPVFSLSSLQNDRRPPPSSVSGALRRDIEEAGDCECSDDEIFASFSARAQSVVVETPTSIVNGDITGPSCSTKPVATAPKVELYDDNNSSHSSFEELGAIGGTSDDSKAATDTNSSNLEQWQLLDAQRVEAIVANAKATATNNSVVEDTKISHAEANAEHMQLALVQPLNTQQPVVPQRAKKVTRRRSDGYLNNRYRITSDDESPTSTFQRRIDANGGPLTEQAEKESQAEADTVVSTGTTCRHCGRNKSNIKRHVERMRQHLESSQMSEDDIKRELESFLTYLEKRTKSIDCSDSETAGSSLSGATFAQAAAAFQDFADNEGIYVYAGSPCAEGGQESRFIKLDDFHSLEDLESLTVKQLKEVLMLNRVDYKGCCEKQELLDRVERLWKNLKSTPAIDKLQTDELCKICMDAPIECVILECGHMATCTNCGKVLSECPICRQYIVRVVRFFRA